MFAYLVNFILMVLFALWFSASKNFNNWKKLFVIMASIQWVILSGLRHYSIGADTYTYGLSFNNKGNSTWESLFSHFYEIYFLDGEGKDPGYAFIEKALFSISDSYQFYLLFIAVFFTCFMGRWIYKNSRDPLLSFLVYSVLFYAFFAITGQRQTLATALAVMIGYKYIKERKLISFTLIILISATIHKSALIFYPFYFIANIKITKQYIIFVYVSFITLFMNKELFSTFLKGIFGYDEYGINKAANTTNFTIIFIIMSIVAIWRSKVILRQNETNIHYFNALLVSLILIPLTFVNPSAMRAVQYYSIFIMLLIPEIIYSFSKRELPPIYFGIVVALFLLLIKSNPTYIFYWNSILPSEIAIN
jgi:hypothetical protein